MSLLLTSSRANHAWLLSSCELSLGFVSRSVLTCASFRYRARSQPNGVETRAKLIEQSTEFFNASLQHLQAPIPLEAQMIAVLDLQYHQFELNGSAAAHSVIL